MSKRPCVRCGEMIEPKAPNHKYCPNCSEWSRKKKARERKAHRAEDDVRRKAMNKPSMSENMKEIARINALARQAGMTYGQYLARLRTGGER